MFTDKKVPDKKVPGLNGGFVPEPFPCEGLEKVCELGHYIGRVIAKPMMAVNVDEIMADVALLGLADSLLRPVNDKQVVSVLDHPSNDHKIITKYDKGGDVQSAAVEFFTSDPTSGKKKLKDILYKNAKGPKSGDDTVFFKLPVGQVYREPSPESPPSSTSLSPLPPPPNYT